MALVSSVLYIALIIALEAFFKVANRGDRSTNKILFGVNVRVARTNLS